MGSGRSVDRRSATGSSQFGTGASQEPLEFGEDLLAGIQIGTARRQIQRTCSHAFDDVTRTSDLVAVKVVHDQDVASMHLRHQMLLHVTDEHGTVDWTIDDQRSDESIQTQTGQERGGLPVTERRVTN